MLYFTDARYWIFFYFFCQYPVCQYLKLIWPIIDTDTNIYVYFFPTPNCRDHQVSSVVEFTYSIIMHSLIVWHKIQIFKFCSSHSLCKRQKILELKLCRTFHIYLL